MVGICFACLAGSEVGSFRKIWVRIFDKLHSQGNSGRVRRDRTVKSIKGTFFWPNMSHDIALLVCRCELCARCKPGPGKGKNQIHQVRFHQPMEVKAVKSLGTMYFAFNQAKQSIYYPLWLLLYKMGYGFRLAKSYNIHCLQSLSSVWISKSDKYRSR